MADGKTVFVLSEKNEKNWESLSHFNIEGVEIFYDISNYIYSVLKSFETQDLTLKNT